VKTSAKFPGNFLCYPANTHFCRIYSSGEEAENPVLHSDANLNHYQNLITSNFCQISTYLKISAKSFCNLMSNSADKQNNKPTKKNK